MPSSPKKTGTRTVSATVKKSTAKAKAAEKAATAKRAESNEKAVPKKAGPRAKAGQLTNQKGGRNKALAHREELRGKEVAKHGEKKVRSIEKSNSDIKWGYFDNPERYMFGPANRFPEDKTSRLSSPSSPARIAKNSSMRLDNARHFNNWHTDTPAQTLWRAGKSSEKLDAQKAASKKAAPKKAAPKKAAPKKVVPKPAAVDAARKKAAKSVAEGAFKGAMTKKAVPTAKAASGISKSMKKPIPKTTQSSSNPKRPSTKKAAPKKTGMRKPSW